MIERFEGDVGRGRLVEALREQRRASSLRPILKWLPLLMNGPGASDMTILPPHRQTAQPTSA